MIHGCGSKKDIQKTLLAKGKIDPTTTCFQDRKLEDVRVLGASGALGSVFCGFLGGLSVGFGFEKKT